MRALEALTRLRDRVRPRTDIIYRRGPLLLLAAAISAGFIGTGLSSTAPVSVATAPAAIALPTSADIARAPGGPAECQTQAWPYFSEPCLRRSAGGPPPRTARVIPITAEADIRVAGLVPKDRPVPPKAHDRRKQARR